MAVNSEHNYSTKRCIDYANELRELCKLPFPAITSIQDINSTFFVALFEFITGFTVPDLLISDDSSTDAHNIQAVIDTLSLDLLGLSLSHITGEDIVSHNVISIFNLLEVLEAVFLHLPTETEEKINETSDKLVKKSTSSDSQENIPSIRVLKRKTCKNTLKKDHQKHQTPKKKMCEISTEPSHSKWKSDPDYAVEPPLKRKNLKPASRTLKGSYTEGIEDLYKSNFEKRIKALLHGDKSPVLRAQQLKKNYIQSLKTSMKRKPIPPCKKSYLLPHNLRHKIKSPVRQHHTKRPSSRKSYTKRPVPENLKNNEQDSEVPAVIQSMLNEFPGFRFPKNTFDRLKNQYYQHAILMHKQLKNVLLKKSPTVIQTEKALEEEAKLTKILDKDLQERKYLSELNEHKAVENRIKSGLRNARLQSVKTRQYFDEFHKAMCRKLQKRNYSEEILIEKTFKEILDWQKEKVQLLCKRVKEANEHDARHHRQYLSALKNLYKQQLDSVAESVATEQKDTFESEKAQKQATEKFNQEVLKMLKDEVRSLQEDVVEMIEDLHFRELDAQNFIQSFREQDS